MKLFTTIFKLFVGSVFFGALASCNNFLNEAPLSEITPENYLTEESQLASYANKLYPDILLGHGASEYGSFGVDNHTDNMAGKTYNNRYVPGQWRVGHSDGEWKFDKIYACNYFLKTVLPRYDEGKIAGNDAKIKQYIGEIYFLRAYEYFNRYELIGDFPIVTEPLTDNMEVLVNASKRAPRNMVARFIIANLDTAITMLEPEATKERTRISRDVAELLKSRVALFEGTWLKYFKNTSLVPGSATWPGKQKEYNSGFAFPSGSIDSEIEYFLTIAMESANKIADKVKLTENTAIVQQSPDAPINPFMNMFSDENMSSYSEVLMWRPYSKALGLTHNVTVAVQHGDYGIGTTRGMVDAFLMENGLPIYAVGSGYAGDDEIADVRKQRDSRLSIFLKEPGQRNVLYEDPLGTMAVPIEPYPGILLTDNAKAYTTGYTIRKGGSFDQSHAENGGSYGGSITFRAAEAHLNYIEACYEKTGSLDGKAVNYWKDLRLRAKIDEDFNKTIAATNMMEEQKSDWGAYSAGTLVDPTLYNIRRERRCELMAEAHRYRDLRRWRAMDQMINTPYHIEGFKLWGAMQDQALYKNTDGSSKLIYGLTDLKSNVSDPSLSKYFRPYQITEKSLAKDGYRWDMAHYLWPINAQHFIITSIGGTVADSPIYQNPGWPYEANQGPISID